MGRLPHLPPSFFRLPAARRAPNFPCLRGGTQAPAQGPAFAFPFEAPVGAVAQLGERYNGIVEVRGSIPLGSTSVIMKLEELHSPSTSCQ